MKLNQLKSEDSGRDVNGRRRHLTTEPLDLLYDRELAAVVIGRRTSDMKRLRSRGLLLLGEILESGDGIEKGMPVYLGAEYPHVVFICGKRGSGKSYTLGVFAEELCRNSLEIATVIVDPIGIFWSLKEKGYGAQEKLKEMGLRHRGFKNTLVMSPPVPGEPPPGNPLTISVSDLKAEDWMAIFDIDPFSQQGNLISDIIKKVKGGYRAARGEGYERVEGKERYTIEDMIRCAEEDVDILSPEKGYSQHTRRSIISRLKAAQSWGFFSPDGTPLSTIARPNAITVLDLSSPSLGDSKRALITGILARNILVSRLGGRGAIPVTWLLIDEAHLILPRGRRTAATEPLVEYAKLGRKPGCGLVLATQRPSATDDDVLSQVDLVVAHTLAMKDDISALLKRMPTHMPKEFSTPSFLRGLKPGEVVVGDQMGGGRAFLMMVRPRLSRHAGETAMPGGTIRKRREERSPLKVLERAPPSLLIETDETETALRQILSEFSTLGGFVLSGEGMYASKSMTGGFTLRELGSRPLKATVETLQQMAEDRGGGAIIIGGVEDVLKEMLPEEVLTLFKELRWRSLKGSSKLIIILDYELLPKEHLEYIERAFDETLLYRSVEGRWERKERELMGEEESRIRIENRVLRERLERIERSYQELLSKLARGELEGLEEGVDALKKSIEEVRGEAREEKVASGYLKALEKDVELLKEKKAAGDKVGPVESEEREIKRGKEGSVEGKNKRVGRGVSRREGGKEKRKKKSPLSDKGVKKRGAEGESRRVKKPMVREGRVHGEKKPLERSTEEAGELKELKPIKGGLEEEERGGKEEAPPRKEIILPVVPPRIEPEWAAEAALKELNIITRRRSDVADIFPFYLPILTVETSAPGGLIKRPRRFYIYVDLHSGELIMGWGRRLTRSEGFPELVTLPPLEAKLMFHLTTHHPASLKDILENFKLPKERVVELLKSLQGRGLIKEEYDSESGESVYSPMKPFYLPKSLRRPLADLPSATEEVVEEHILKPRADEKKTFRTLAFLEDRLRMGERRRIYYPYYLVDVDTPKGLRRFAVDAVTGRVDRDLKGISRIDMIPPKTPKKLKLKMRSPGKGGRPRPDRGPKDSDDS